MAYRKTNVTKRQNPRTRLILDGSHFVDYSYEEETSYFDPNPKKFWDFGNDCYKVKLTCRVPKNIKNPEEWICDNIDNVKWLNY